MNMAQLRKWSAVGACATLTSVLGVSGVWSPVASAAAKTKKSAIQVPAPYRKGFSVAMQDAEPPEAYLNSSGTELGISPSLVRAISSVIGTPIHIVPTTFENELLGLKAGRYAFVTDTNVTSQREALYDQFAYYYDNYSFITVKGQPKLGNAISDLCGKTIGDETGDGAIPFIQAYSTSCSKAGKKAITLTQEPTYSDLLLSMEGGRLDAVTVPTDTGHYMLTEKANKNLQMDGPTYNKVLVGMSFPKKSPLLPVIVAAMKVLVRNGTYKKIMLEYGYGPSLQTTDFAVNRTPLTPTP